ncbi:5'-nucleotidase C-terminal domain-containing protein [Hymenobacter sp. BT188]|uniref:5'-nucleotidase C-terminal domain-containing protein n=1 Tax=Hymenobacter sp. BT188 TaxID=2763504 RepID=UPI001651AF70|nr:5'-nucleotidase C-terminal domain-containing protein [Hymenobacter sp. BT188]MBC6606570.1 5'-nucleotidase C-terminal domain-containing protein [Hymenobacter sp. BT188]
MHFLRFRVVSLGLFLAVVATPACQRAAYVAKPTLAPTTAQPVGQTLPPDPKIAAIIEPYQQKVTQQMTEVIGTAPVAISKNPGESPLANFVADLVRQRATVATGKSIDVSVMPNGGLRANLPAGKITLGAIFELMPFENEVVVLDAPGPVMQQLFDYSARIKMALSGATYAVGADGKPMNIMIGGRPFNPVQTYTVALSDYTAGGGDNMVFFKTLKPTGTGVLLRNAIADHIRQLTKEGKPVEAKVEGRVKVL